jgi:hypothetical protein
LNYSKNIDTTRISYNKIHPDAITYSQPINTQEIVRLFQELQEQEAIELELKKIEKEIKKNFDDELKILVSDFIQVHKKRMKGNKEVRKKIKELNAKLEKEITKESIEMITNYCERFIKAEQDQLQ